jgi:hypothetical protein
MEANMVLNKVSILKFMARSLNKILFLFKIRIVSTRVKFDQEHLDQIYVLLSRLHPVSTGFSLVRIGDFNDGGYCLPDDFENSLICFSPGSDGQASFELALRNNYAISSFILDEATKRPLNLPGNIEFDEGWLTPHSSSAGVSLEDWIKSKNISSDKDLILQMDIEGAEYQCLMALSTEALKKFRIIVIEFHYFEKILDSYTFINIFSPSFARLFEHFDVVNTHPNNCCGEIQIGKATFPRVFEVTFHRKDRRRELPKDLASPSDLNARNIEEIDEVKINWSHIKLQVN